MFSISMGQVGGEGRGEGSTGAWSIFESRQKVQVTLTSIYVLQIMLTGSHLKIYCPLIHHPLFVFVIIFGNSCPIM